MLLQNRNGSKELAWTCKLVTCANLLITRRGSKTGSRWQVSMLTTGLQHQYSIGLVKTMEHAESCPGFTEIIINDDATGRTQESKRTEYEDGFNSHSDIWW